MAKKTKPKPSPKTKIILKKGAKAPTKTAAKPVKKLLSPAKKAVAPTKSTKRAKVVAKPVVPKKGDVKNNVKPVHKSDKKQSKEEVKTTASKVVVVTPIAKSLKTDNKQQTKPASKVKGKVKKVEKKEEDFDDDLLGDDFGDSEIAEYEDDLKAVEEEDDDLNEDLSDEDETEEKETEIYLTDSEGRRLCRVRDCDQVANVEGYCRFHYLLLWKKIQIRKAILVDGKLEKYIEDLTSRYPDKFLEMIKKDMKSEKDFTSAIQELEIDESALNENDSDDDAQSYADEIRGVGDAPVIDDDGDF